jgi:branched-chain amino acid transport system substrate-binding protein
MPGTARGAWRLGLIAIVAGLALGARPATASHQLVIGMQCDRTGPTRAIGTKWCRGYRDAIDLVNAKGGVGGHALKVVEIDHGGRVPAAMAAYEQFKREGAVLVFLYGLRETRALGRKLGEDRLPGTAPGFSPAAAGDGQRFPYLFPVAATAWSQAAAAVKYADERLRGLRGKRIAYLFADDPAGREPIPLLEALATRGGFELQTVPVPAAGADLAAEIGKARRGGAQFVIANLFGRGGAVPLRDFARAGFSLHRVVSLAWGSAETDVEAGELDVEAGRGFAAADGYSGIEFAGVGSDYPVLKEIREMYTKQGKALPPEMESPLYYNRGPFVAAVHVEAIKNALRARPDGRITGEDVKTGLERIKGLPALGGLAPPFHLTPADHEGGGWVQVWQVRNGGFVRATDWIRPYRTFVERHLKEDRNRSAGAAAAEPRRRAL